MDLLAPQARLAMVETTESTSTTTSLVGIDIEALIQAID
jgi:hypothetical protein